ncbi:MAG: DUF2059 domain-containing protein [Acidobacteriaceae bacterium]
MKRWIAMLVVVVSLTPMVARADEASKTAKVKELFAVMHTDHNLDRMMSSMQRQIELTAQNVSGADAMTPEKKKIQDEFVANSMKAVNATFGWTVLEPAYLKLYVDTFTDAELDGMLAFYKSPAGQAMLTKTPQLSAGVMQIVHGQMNDLQPRMQAMQELYVKAMAASTPAAH